MRNAVSMILGGGPHQAAVFCGGIVGGDSKPSSSESAYRSTRSTPQVVDEG